MMILLGESFEDAALSNCPVAALPDHRVQFSP